MSHPQAFFLRPHLFLCSRLASMSAKIRQEALAQEVPPMTVIWRLMQQASATDGMQITWLEDREKTETAGTCA